MVLLSKRYSHSARRAFSFIAVFCFLSTGRSLSVAQSSLIITKNESDDIPQLRRDFVQSTQFIVDTTLKGLQHRVEALTNSTTLTVTVAGKRLTGLADSLIVSAHDSLDASRQDSLRAVSAALVANFASHESSARQLFASRLSKITGELARTRKTLSDCPDCENRSDFDERLEEFKDFADSLISEFHETASSQMEESGNILTDALEAARDSLRDYRNVLIENRLSGIEMWRYGTSRLVLSSAFANHSSYRGRDNGLLQQSIAPSVTYRHSSGLAFQASSYFVNDAGSQWDNFQLTGGYEFRLSNVVGGSLSYAHFWFRDSSKTELSVFTDNVQGGFSFDWPAVSIGVLGSMNFGTASEFTLITSISHNFEIPLNLYNKVTISPSFSWVLGQQNSELTTLLTTKANGKRPGVVIGTQTKSTSRFSVLDYEVSLPASIEWGPVTLAPSATYIIPLNVVDASTRKSFINLEFSIFLTIR